MVVYLYILVKFGIPHYVGKTNSLSRRKSGHKKRFPGSDLEVIDVIPISEWKFWERHYISLFRSWGFRLDNKNDGGGGTSVMSPETRKKMSDSRKGYIFPDETKRRISIARTGKIHSDETRQKMANAKIGKFRSPEVGRKISKSKTGKARSLETRNKISRTLLEKKKNIIS